MELEQHPHRVATHRRSGTGTVLGGSSKQPHPQHTLGSSCHAACWRGVTGWGEMKPTSSLTAPLGCLLHRHASRAGAPQLMGDPQGWTGNSHWAHLQQPMPQASLSPLQQKPLYGPVSPRLKAQSDARRCGQHFWSISQHP